jgi:hypothetical protein
MAAAAAKKTAAAAASPPVVALVPFVFRAVLPLARPVALPIALPYARPTVAAKTTSVALVPYAPFAPFVPFVPDTFAAPAKDAPMSLQLSSHDEAPVETSAATTTLQDMMMDVDTAADTAADTASDTDTDTDTADQFSSVGRELCTIPPPDARFPMRMYFGRMASNATAQVRACGTAIQAWFRPPSLSFGSWSNPMSTSYSRTY